MEFIIADEIEPDTFRFIDDKNNNFLKDLVDQKFIKISNTLCKSYILEYYCFVIQY